jgi:hypothetical protein
LLVEINLYAVMQQGSAQVLDDAVQQYKIDVDAIGRRSRRSVENVKICSCKGKGHPNVTSSDRLYLVVGSVILV